MIRLMICQLKQLLPFVALWAAIATVFYALEISTNRIDELSYLDWCGPACNVGSAPDLVLFSIFLYMIAAYSLFPREFDEGTIDFVRSLPLSRGQIFFAKVLAAWLLICLLITAEFILLSLALGLNTQTITGLRYWHNELIFYLRYVLFAFVIVAHGVFISWFRTVGLILYCVYLVGLIFLEQSFGVSGPYNLFSFFNNEYHGQRLLVDWPSVITHLLVAVVLLAVSYELWTRTDTKPKQPGKGRLSRFLPVMVSTIAFVVAVLTMLALLLQAGNSNNRGNIEQLASTHYNFAYHVEDNSRMVELEQYADDDYQALSTLLGATDQPFIHADMTSQSKHALGVATYKKIRMVLNSNESVNPVYRRVLSHETAHVFQTTESSRKLIRAGNTVGFFVEGMAQYTSFSIVPDQQRRSTNWVISSVAWQRHNITFDILSNRAAFETLYDPELLYGIGDIWVDAMATTCGESSIGDFLRSTGDEKASPDISGVRYWRHHLQNIGCDLEEVNHNWRQQMQHIVDTRDDGAFPTFDNVTLTSRDNSLVITANVTPGSTGLLPQRYYIRVEGETRLARTISPIRTGQQIQTEPTVQVEFTVPSQEIEGSRFRYQIGYDPYPDSRYYFEKWRSGSR